MTGLPWVIGSFLDQWRWFRQLSWSERRENVKFILIFFAVLAGWKKSHPAVVNTYFNVWDLPRYRSHLTALVRFHRTAALRMLNPKYKGIKAWEYGRLLSTIPLTHGTRVLDVGTGGSVIPYYLASLGMRVRTLDLPDAQEKPLLDHDARFSPVTCDQGTMLRLPYNDTSFDVVLAVSSIEHLDKKSDVPLAIAEMARVTKIGGHIFLTSDIYLPVAGEIDRWRTESSARGWAHAFSPREFTGFIIRELERSGCFLVGQSDFRPELMTDDVNRSTYRGRHYSTFALYVRKKA